MQFDVVHPVDRQQCPVIDIITEYFQELSLVWGLSQPGRKRVRGESRCKTMCCVVPYLSERRKPSGKKKFGYYLI